MNKRNYAKELEKILQEKQAQGVVPRVLLHVCCAPCSSYCLEYLRQYFDVTVFYYNPNITEEEEYCLRAAEEERLIKAYNIQVETGNFEQKVLDQDGNETDEIFPMHSDEAAHTVTFTQGNYDKEAYLERVAGLEEEPEGGKRCTACFSMRLEESAKEAAKGGYDFFTTTLTISPLKDAERLNRIGEFYGKKYGVAFLPSDFKKKDGYKRSIELSKAYGLYRQDYCGCSFSKGKPD